MMTSDTDKIQVWKYRSEVKPGWDWGRISTTTVEIVDFQRGVVSTHTTGMHEGTRIDQRGGYEISPEACPEGAATYRRSHGYTRIK
jgi:hypothetical protein